MAEDSQDQSDKTEEPTQRKLEEAHKRGDVAKSQEVPTLLVLFAGTLILLAAAPWSARETARILSAIFAGAHDIPMDGTHLRLVMLQLVGGLAIVVGLPLIGLLVAGFLGHVIQHKFVWSLEPITPKFSKVSPLAGFKRLFSVESLVNFVKGLIKIVIVGGAIWLVIWPERDKLDLLVSTDVRSLLGVTQTLTLKLLGAVLAVMLVIAALDFAFQRFRWLQRQRMSIKEMKEEFKQQEGSPEIKAKVRQIRTERARRRMMSEVPKATVVITNPTHFAVALRYEKGMAAPVCVAKGVDAVALRIRALATDSGVPVVENPPLARVLHATVDLDEEIPAEHYRAVAQVIGYVMNLRNRRAWSAG